MSRSGLYRFFWISAFVALIIIGAPKFRKPGTTLPLADRGRDGSVNSVLMHTLGEPDLALRISEWLAKLPRGRPILVLAPPDHTSAALTADLMSYLAWPRPVVVNWDREQSQELLGDFPARYCAVGLCYLPPPAGATHTKAFGNALTFISSEAIPE